MGGSQTTGGGLGQAVGGERNNRGKPGLFGVLLVEPCKRPASSDVPSRVVLSAEKGSPALSLAMLHGCRNGSRVSHPREQAGGTAEGEFGVSA